MASKREKKKHIENVAESLNFNAEWNESYAMILLQAVAATTREKEEE